MSSSATEQRRGTRLKPLVEFAAAGMPAQERQPQRQPQRAIGEGVGVPIGLIRAGSTVLCSDGRAGRVARVVAHSQHGHRTYLIVRQGRLQPREFRVAYNWVHSIAPDQVTLSLCKDDLAQQPEYRPDDEIAEAVEDLFHGAEAFHDHADYLALQASVEDGTVTLRGNVRNSARRLEAEQIVRRIRGVIAVENCLFADDEIEWKTGWVLQRDPRLQASGLRVETCLGLVRLYGQIGSLSQRALATTIVTQVPGVHAINNGLTVTPALESRDSIASAPTLPQVEELVVQ